jgi:hypothetical protein
MTEIKLRMVFWDVGCGESGLATGQNFSIWATERPAMSQCGASEAGGKPQASAVHLVAYSCRDILTIGPRRASLREAVCGGR